MGTLTNFESSDYAHGYVSRNCKGLLFPSILRMCVQNLKFVAQPIPEIIGGTQKTRQSLDTPTLLFPKIFSGLLFGWTLWMYLPNLKFMALPDAGIIEYSENFESPWIRPRSLFSHILQGFCSDGPVNAAAKFEVCSFTRSWDNKGYSKKLGSPWIRPRSLFSKIFKEILFRWTLWMSRPNLKFVALHVPEIIGGTPTNSAVTEYARALFSPKFLMGFCSHRLSKYTCQIWSS